MTTIDQAFQTAVRHHQAGELPQAEGLYRQILAQQPTHVGAMHYLGVLAGQVGKHDVAVDLIRRAVALSPNDAEAYANLGIVLRDSGRPAEAAVAFRRAVALQPKNAVVWNNLGVALQSCGNLNEAVAGFRQAIAQKPDYPEVWNNLGSALKAQDQVHESIDAFRKALALRPDLSEVHGNLGAALLAAGEMEEALAASRQALVLKPNDPIALCNLGNVLHARGQLKEAIACFRQAIALRPNYAKAYSNLGGALAIQGEFDEAVACLRKAIALAPNFPDAHNNLGNVLSQSGPLDDAIAAFRLALALNPQSLESRNNLANALKNAGQLDDAIATFHEVLAILPQFAEAHSDLVYALHFHPGYDASALAQEQSNWNRTHAEPLRKFIQPHTNDRSPDRRLRIGYVSPDLREHAVARFLLPLLQNQDRNQVQIFAYAQVARPDAMTARLQQFTDRWQSIVGLPDAQVADLIRQDEIDILVDLAMHTANNRLRVFARKPAPVQVTYLAFCSSTGLETMDYRLSDPYLDPPGEASFYSERTIHLPESYWCYQPSDVAPLVGPLPAAERGFITFGCLNNFCKATEPAQAAWIEILKAAPNSQLLIHAHEGAHRQRLRDRLERDGIDPNRLQFTGILPMADYLQLYGQIDIALDPFPFAGGTTTCDALWMGVPVVSLAGRTAVGRAGLSLLSNVGLPELVAKSPEAYVQIAGDLANDLPRLEKLRSTLRSRMERSPLMDAPCFARHIEAAYRQMWRRWCETPDS